MTSNITIASWNMRSLVSAKPYINELLNMSDVLVLSEHRLFKNELHKLGQINCNIEYEAKASDELDSKDQSNYSGHCGIAIFWQRKLSNRVKVINNESDRICAIEVINVYNTQSMFIISVYLPQQGCKKSSFITHLEIMEKLVWQCKRKGEVIIIGDFNCHFGFEVGPHC